MTSMIFTNPKRILLVVLLAALSLSLCACDPAIGYGPQGWTKEGQKQWTGTFENLDLKLDEFYGFIAQDYLMPGLDITNRGKSPVRLLSVVLKIAASEHAVELSKDSMKPILPNDSRGIALFFKFDSPLYKVFKEPVVLRLKFKIVDREAEFSIPMEQTFGKK